jgi:endoglycosylceramidase
VRRLVILVALIALPGAQVAAASNPTASNVTRLAKKAAPKGPLGHSGRWITDRSGRVVILHGLNMVYKRPPYAPDATGFGADDAAFLRRYGFNTIRLGVIYSGVEPEPGRYDDAYLARIARTERLLARRGVFSQLDFHQDLYNERFGGEGWPDWAVLDDGMPAEPLTGFPGSYVTSPGLNRAFDNFWANATGPGGVGLVDRYAAAWRHVAARFKRRPQVMGYDLLNEPWPGSEWPSCANPEGCPVFDEGEFTDFYEKVIAAIRQTDRRNLIWYEPQVQFNFGSDSSVDGLADPRLGFSFHVYCLSAAAGGGNSPACETADNLVFDNADKQARQTGSALLLSEFGATDENDVNLRIVESADEHRVSWQYWHYCGCRDPTTQAGPGDTQAVVREPRRAPRGKNLKHAKLRVLVRPYPQAIAGTPLRFEFDPETKRFELVYSTRPAADRRGRLRRGLTDVFVPKLHYRRGYRVRVRGARYYVAGGQHLILRARPGARRVSVVVRPR